MAVLYKSASLENGQVFIDVPYREGSTDRKHRLDLFLPQGTGWPILIFIHGGGLASGDKSFRVSGEDVYGNIGRFYASQGIGVAVINYRLQPKVTWREQVDDVASATGWLAANLGLYGADTSRIFIGGHSAGAHLASRIALDPKPLAQFGFSPANLSGVIAISGAGYDLADNETYELGRNRCRYETCFRCGDPTDNWMKEASPISFITPNAPPFLIIYAERETKSLIRQSELLHAALQRKQVPTEILVAPRQNHSRIVLTLSRPDKVSAPAILRFINGSPAQATAPCDQLLEPAADRINAA
jgi:acetyl esterase/lipase